MSLVHLFTFEGLQDFEFAHLPKQNMCELSMNPYNGKVFFKVAKQRDSAYFALRFMREIVRVCDKLERDGSDDPLGDLLSLVDGSNWETLSGAGAEILAFVEKEEEGPATGGEGIGKAS